MKSIAKPGSFGYSRSDTGERFTKNWLTACGKQDGVDRVAYRKETRVVGSAARGICISGRFKVFAKQTVKM
jgi:hypothetical protein